MNARLKSKTKSRRSARVVARQATSSDLGGILLSDGQFWKGQILGAKATRTGEFVFHTGYTGYQEVLTDPSYYQQIICFSSPQIGNQGFHSQDFESAQVWAFGCVLRDYQDAPKHWRKEKSLQDVLVENDRPALRGVDTRSLTHHLRDRGCLWGVISTETCERKELAKHLDSQMSMSGLSLTSAVGTKEVYLWTEASNSILAEQREPKFVNSKKNNARVVVLDLGVKRQILRYLVDLGFSEVIVVPRTSTSADILSLKPSALLISNGPGDPAAELEAIQLAKDLIGRLPIFGICLGHQILGLALGLKTYKLRFGHHAANHPVMNLETGKVEITSQNHGFAVEAPGEPSEIIPTHIHLNDKSLAGFRHRRHPVWAIQFHPESSPGPMDSIRAFQNFYEGSLR